MKTSNRRRLELKQKGFTLIEVVIGLVILSVGLLGVAGMQITAVKGNYFSKNLTQASYIGQDRLELLKNLPIASLDPGAYTESPVTISGQVFNRSYTVAANGNLRTITYTVSWFDGVNHTVSFQTIRSL